MVRIGCQPARISWPNAVASSSITAVPDEGSAAPNVLFETARFGAWNQRDKRLAMRHGDCLHARAGISHSSKRRAALTKDDRLLGVGRARNCGDHVDEIGDLVHTRASVPKQRAAGEREKRTGQLLRLYMRTVAGPGPM